jgi:hypothetical protein
MVHGLPSDEVTISVSGLEAHLGQNQSPLGTFLTTGSWNSLRMGPNQSITEYNNDFQQALTDLAGHVTDEQVKIEKYRSGTRIYDSSEPVDDV